MKTIIVSIFTFCTSIMIIAQVAIGKDTPHSSALLDFGNDENKGIVLPHVKTLNSSSVPGTLYYDATKSKVKLRIDNNADIDLTVKAVSTANAFNVAATEYTKYKEVASNDGVLLSDSPTPPSSIPVGVLVLDSKTRALALPTTTDFKKLGQASPGTIVYDSAIKKICIYDGEKWSFWGK